MIEALAVYPNWDDLRRKYPELEPEDIRQALEFAAQNLDTSVQDCSGFFRHEANPA